MQIGKTCDGTAGMAFTAFNDYNNSNKRKKISITIIITIYEYIQQYIITVHNM